MKILIPAASLFATALAVGPVFANDVAFSYSASELRSSSSISALYERMEEKVSNACALYENSGLLGVEYQKACTRELLDELVAGIDNSALTALHEERHSARFAANS